MSLRALLEALRSVPTVRRAGFRPRLEPLDDRRLPSFTPAGTYPVSGEPVAADFNNDGRLDLAAAEYGVRVLLGNTDGSFQPPRYSGTGEIPVRSLAVGDFNTDGNLDLATGHDGYWYLYENGYGEAVVNILLGRGDGTFNPPVAQPIHGAAVSASVAAGDMNDDGSLDLVVTSYEYYSMATNGSTVTVLLGHGDGTFAHGSSYWWVGEWLTTPALGDLDGDGNTDVAVNGPYWVGVYPGNGDGTLGPPRTLVDSGWYGEGASVGDFDGDGNLDLVAEKYYSDSVALHLGNGDGTFQAVRSFAAGDQPNSTAAGDINGDGVLDLVVTNSGWYSPDGGSVSVLLGIGGGRFAPPITAATSPYPNDVTLADLNADGRLDAVVMDDGLSVLLNDGDWPFPPSAVSVGDATVTEGNAGSANATFTLTLSHAAAADVTVHFETADLTAAAGSDYTAAAGDVVIPAGRLSATVVVTVRGDRLPEPGEFFTVNLSAPTNATIGDGQGIGTIRDDEPRIGITDASLKEGHGGARLMTFTVTLSAAYDMPVEVGFATRDGTATAGEDYVPKSGTLTFAPGETTRTITVAIKGDKKKEANETFAVALTALSGHASLAADLGWGTILNDD